MLEKLEIEPVSAETSEKPTASETEEAQAAIAAVEAETAELTAKLKEMEDRYLRLAAEFDNFRKRTAKEFQTVIRTANARVLIEILELSDNFERALTSAAPNPDSLRQGVLLIANQLKDFLKKEGIEELNVAGQPFDPATAEAVMQVESNEPEGKVIEVLAKGYLLSGQVLRPAKVVVSKGAFALQSEEESSPE